MERVCPYAAVKLQALQKKKKGNLTSKRWKSHLTQGRKKGNKTGDSNFRVSGEILCLLLFSSLEIVSRWLLTRNRELFMPARRSFACSVQRSGDCESQVMEAHFAGYIRAAESFSWQFAGPLNLFLPLIVPLKRHVVNVINGLQACSARS